MSSNVTQLILDLLARDKTGPATKSSADNLKTVGDAAGDAAKDTEKLGKESDKTEDKVGGLGKSARTAAQHVEHLDREIESVEKELRQLAVSFAEAQTAADRLDLTRAIRRTEADLKRLNKSKGLLAGLIPDKPEEIIPPELGQKVGRNLGKDIKDGFESAKGPLIGALGAALGPTVGAVIAAGVIGAAGAGGILGGVAAVAKDPSIAGTAKAVGKNWVDGVNAEAKQAFLKPTQNALGQVEKFAERSVGKIGKIFDSTGPQLEDFTASILHAGDAILDGLVDSAGKSAPVMRELGNVIADTGDSVGELLSTISDHSDEAASGLRDVNGALQDTIGVVGDVIGLLLELKGAIDTVDELAHKSEFLGKAFDVVDAGMKGPLGLFGLFKDGLDKSSEATDDLTESQKSLTPAVLSAAEAAGVAGPKMSTFGDAMSDAATKGRGLYDSQTDVAQAIADTEKAMKDNGKTLDINTQKGRDNRKALSDLAGTLTANYDAYVKVNGEGAGAARVASTNREAFIRLAMDGLNLSRRKADELASSLGLIKPKKTIDFYANTHDAQARIDALKGNIASVKGKTVTVTVKTNKAGDEALHGFRAAGGPVKKNKAYVVGEHRAEVFVPDQDGTIIPSIDKYRNGAGAAGGGTGAGVQRLIIEFATPELARLLRYTVRDAGGVAAFFGSS